MTHVNWGVSRQSPPKVTLASASPRRRELLAYLGISFESIATDGEERDTPLPSAVITALPPAPLTLENHPTQLAWRKVQAACADAPESVIIGVDTIVVLDGDVLGKPRDPEHAHHMLRRLSGNTHTVYTGLAVLQFQDADREVLITTHHQDLSAFPHSKLLLELTSSQVTIAPLTDTEIAEYVATGEPLDKAGSYGIQGLGGRLVQQVVGSYTCVVGLPLVTIHRMLQAAGINQMTDPEQAYLHWLRAQGKEPLPCPPTFP